MFVIVNNVIMSSALSVFRALIILSLCVFADGILQSFNFTLPTCNVGVKVFMKFMYDQQSSRDCSAGTDAPPCTHCVVKRYGAVFSNKKSLAHF